MWWLEHIVDTDKHLSYIDSVYKATYEIYKIILGILLIFPAEMFSSCANAGQIST